MLARSFEAAGFATILVTNMPFWAEKIGVPRCLAVEYPFGHLLGLPDDAAMQLQVISQALQVLERAETPGTIVHSPLVWPLPHEQALLDWQPAEPSPIVKLLAPRIKTILREKRGRSNS